MAEGMARHEREDIVAILRRDIQAVDDLLGDKKFLFGDKPTTVCLWSNFLTDLLPQNASQVA